MSRLYQKIKGSLGVGIFAFFLFSSSLFSNALAFQDASSEVILKSLQKQPNHIFLNKLYRQVLFMPIWMHEKGLSPSAKALFHLIENEGTLEEGGPVLQAAFSLESEANNLYAKGGTLLEKMHLEFKISQLYKAFTDYAYLGSINWGAFQARIANLRVNDVKTEWVLHRPTVNPALLVERAMLGEPLDKLLQQAIPTAYHYRALQEALKRYMALAKEGGWEAYRVTTKLTRGMMHEDVRKLRARLAMTNDYEVCSDTTIVDDVYGACLEKAVKHFQARHGLLVDGVVGTGTQRHLNESVTHVIEKIRLNLDRIKWLAKRSGNRHIIINIPAFRLYFEENGELIQTMRVVTGKPNHPTPIFSDTVEYIVLNPYWNVPKSIIQKEFVPKLIRNPYAMERKGIEIRRGWGKNAEVIDPGSVDWSNYTEGHAMPFHFAQLPGKRNALGKVKFLFPNKFAVYMHDTPSKSLFSRTKRAFSHGCIRLQKPRELLRTFSTFNSNIDFDAAQKQLEGKTKKSIALKKRVPVDIVYLTAWVDYEGVLQLRDDVYGYDKMQLKSFRHW